MTGNTVRNAFLLCLVGLFTLAACSGAHGTIRTQRPSDPALVLDYLWSAELAPRDGFWDREDFELASPVPLGPDLVLVGTSEATLVALKIGTGKKVWQFQGEEEFVAPPTVANGTVYIGGVNGRVHALNPRSGQELWSYDTTGSIEGPVAATADKVFVTNSLNRIIALDAESGEFLWRQQRPRTNDFTMFGHAGPVVSDGAVFAGFSDGQMMAYATEDGATIWGRNLSHDANRFKDIDDTPVLADGSLFAASFAGGLHRMNPETGEVIWHREIEGVEGLQFINGVLYFSSREGIHAASAEDGQDIWLHPFEENLLASAPAVGRHYMFVSLQREGLLVLDRVNGEQLALIDTGSGITSAPLLVEGTVLAFSNGGLLYAWMTPDGPMYQTAPAAEPEN